jgi:hypothetical protein
LSKRFLGARIVSFPIKKPWNIYKRHQIVITELGLGAVGTDFSRRTSWWARENPGRARRRKSMRNIHFSEMYTNAKNTTINGPTSCISG